MDKTNWIKGYELMGFPYDAQNGIYANSKSINLGTQLFEFNFDTENGSQVSIDGRSYWVPAPLTVSFLGENIDNEVESFESEDIWTQYSVDVQYAETSPTFSGSVEAGYSEDFTSSSNYWHSRCLSGYKSYRIVLPSDIKAYLTEKAKSLINDSSIPASEVIEQLGTHYFTEGIFGGRWLATQSISQYTETDEKDANIAMSSSSAFIQANGYASYLDSYAISTFDSSLTIVTNGGGTYNKNAADGYDQWLNSIIEEGDYALIRFNGNKSLVPLSDLADDSQRQQELEDAIREYYNLPVPKVYNLQINEALVEPIVQKSADGTYEQKYVATDPDLVLVGFGASVNNDGNCTKMLMRYLNLVTNTLHFQPTPSNQSTDYKSYERYVEIPYGYAIVGLGGAVDDNNVKSLTAWYMEIDPSDSDKNNNFLSGAIQELTVGSGKLELSYRPSAPANAIPLVGVGISAEREKISLLDLWAGPFMETQSEDSQNQQLAFQALNN